MAAADHLALYAEGWTNGDLDTILSSVADDYVFDDPNAAPIPKSEFAVYLAGLKETVAAMRGDAASDGPFIALSEIVSTEADGVVTAWCWWEFPGTPLQGSGLIKVDKGGVRSERITYYTRLPD